MNETVRTSPLRHSEIDGLKVLLTILVVLHHALLAYTTSKVGSLVYDPAEFIGFDFVTGLLDRFFMFAFFFLSGLLVWRSVERRGATRWMVGRVVRLGLPFVLGILILNVITYTFSGILWIKQNIDPNYVFQWNEFGTYFRDSVGRNGYQLWFLWVLLGFDLILFVVIKVFPKLAEKIEKSQSSFYFNPVRFRWMMLGLSIASYVPFAYLFSGTFIGVGPFTMQFSRLFTYLLFFIIGVLFGIKHKQPTVIATEGAHVDRWWVQLLIGVATYSVIFGIYVAAAGNTGLAWLYVIAMFLQPIVILTMTFGLYQFFQKHHGKFKRWIDSLSKHAFSIYVLHYVIVIGFQTLFVDLPWPAVLKGLLVFLISFAATWALAVVMSKATNLFIRKKA